LAPEIQVTDFILGIKTLLRIYLFKKLEYGLIIKFTQQDYGILRSPSPTNGACKMTAAVTI